MGVIVLKKLNEHHDDANKFPPELLNMKVSDLLDKIGELDTQGDAEYEIVEDALIALKDKILGTGYESEEEIDFIPVEDPREEEKEDKDPLADQMQTYDEITSNQDFSNSQDSRDNGLNMDNFEF